MAGNKFKCAKCDRAFSMAAHLARHTSASHGPKRGKASAKKGKVRAKARSVRKAKRKKAAGVASNGRRARRLSISGGAVQLVRGMHSYYNDLLGRRDQIDAEISAIGNAMKALGAVSAPARPPARRGRAPARAAKKGSLRSYIVKILGQRSSPMGPSDIAAKVIRAGYKSAAKDLTKAVSNTLPHMKEIKKVGFGMYKIP